MKTIVAILCLAAGFCRADVQMLVHVVDMPQQRFAELLSASAGGDDLFMKVHAEVSAGRAQAVDTSVVRVRAGERASLESVGEVIFPTEPEPPQLCTEIGSQAVQIILPPPPDIRIGSFYFGFEIRNTGVTLDIEPSLSHGLIELRSEWKSVFDPGSHLFESWRDELDQLHQFKQPHFTIFSSTLSLVLKPGSWVLASVNAGKASDGTPDMNRKTLIFVRADDLDAPAKK